VNVCWLGRLLDSTNRSYRMNLEAATGNFVTPSSIRVINILGTPGPNPAGYGGLGRGLQGGKSRIRDPKSKDAGVDHRPDATPKGASTQQRAPLRRYRSIISLWKGVK
jgi:hypothetical protein